MSCCFSRRLRLEAKLSCLFLAFFLMVLASLWLTVPAAAVDPAYGTEYQITDELAEQINPAIYRNKVVWQDKRNGDWDIYMYNFWTRTEKQITTDPADQIHPSIYGNKIVWEDTRNGNLDIYMYDLSAGTEKQITGAPSDQQEPKIFQNTIVWTDHRDDPSGVYKRYGDIYMYDGDSGAEKPITQDDHTGTPAEQRSPRISGDYVAWFDYRRTPDVPGSYYWGYRSIYYYKISDGLEGHIASEEVWDPLLLDLDEGRIIWSRGTGLGYTAAYMYELSTGSLVQLPIGSIAINSMDLQSENIVCIYVAFPWIGYPDAYSMWLYDLSLQTNTMLKWNGWGGPAIHDVAIDGNLIVWEDWRNGNSDLYAMGTPPPPPTRAELVESIERLHTTILTEYDTNIRDTAGMYGIASYYRNNLQQRAAEWLSFFWKSINNALSIFNQILAKIGTPLKLFFSPQSLLDDPSAAPDAIKLFYQTQETGGQPSMAQGNLFMSGLLGDYGEPRDYTLFVNRDSSDLTRQADELYKVYGDPVKIAEQMENYLRLNPYIRVARRSGVILPGQQQPSVVEPTVTLNEARRKIDRQFKDLIARIPDPLPKAFPTAEVIDDIERVRSSINAGKSHTVIFPAVPNQTNEVDVGHLETRKVMLGVLQELGALGADLERAQEQSLAVKQQKVVSDGVGIALNVTSLLTLGEGDVIKHQIIDGIDLAYGGFQFGATGTGVVPEHEVAPIQAMQENQLEMTIKLREQESRLWAISDGVEQYVRYKMALSR